MTDAELLETCRQAFARYQDALGVAGDPAATQYAAGRVWELLGRPADALDAYRGALAEPTARAWPVLLSAVERCATGAGLEAATAAFLAVAAESRPALAAADLSAGRLFRLGGRPEDAVAVLRRGIARVTDPTLSIGAHDELVYTLFRAGRADEAIAHCRAAAAELPPAGAASLTTSMASFIALGGDPEQALAEVDQVLAGWPELAPAHFVRGAVLLRLGRRPEAEAAFGEATARQPDLAAQAADLLGEAP